MALQEYKLKGLTSLSLQPGEKKEVEVEGLAEAKVLLVNVGGKLQAVGPKCTHYSAPLVKGVLTTDGRLTCPWHGACFNAITGDIEDAPALDALAVFSVFEKSGAVYVTGDASVILAGRRKPSFKCVAAKAEDSRVVVVGGGSGALGLVQGLREKGFSGPITLISNEGYLPIDRPKLSKALLSDPAKLAWRDAEWFKSRAVDVIDDEVTGVDFASKTVLTKSPSSFRYNKLVLATGGVAKMLPLQGFRGLGNIFTLRTVHDVKKIVGAIGESKGKKIVIVGSSFIGMEVAGATADGNHVTVIGMEKTPLERVMGDKVGHLIRKNMEAKGIEFYMSAGVEKAAPSSSDPSKVGAVHLKDGTVVAADLVILGVGVAPATGYLQDNAVAHLQGDGSLKTDESFSVVGLRDVYAIGDIATFPYHGPGGGGRFVRIEHWNVAQNAGRVAASHIVSPTIAPANFIPVFWSALGAQLRYCGHAPDGFDDVVMQAKPEKGRWAAFYVKGNQVVAAASMGMDPVVMQSAELMRIGKMPGRKELEEGLDVMSLEVAH